MTCMPSGFKQRAVSTTRLSIGVPPTLCSTLGVVECIRLPWPAARMTMFNDMVDEISYGLCSHNDGRDLSNTLKMI